MFNIGDEDKQNDALSRNDNRQRRDTYYDAIVQIGFSFTL